MKSNKCTAREAFKFVAIKVWAKNQSSFEIASDQKSISTFTTFLFNMNEYIVCNCPFMLLKKWTKWVPISSIKLFRYVMRNKIIDNSYNNVRMLDMSLITVSVFFLYHVDRVHCFGCWRVQQAFYPLSLCTLSFAMFHGHNFNLCVQLQGCPWQQRRIQLPRRWRA